MWNLQELLLSRWFSSLVSNGSIVGDNARYGEEECV